MTCVERLPSTGGNVNAAVDGDIRPRPGSALAELKNAAAPDWYAVLMSARLPSIDASRSAPVTATSAGRSNRSSGPSSVASSVAASAALPTSALA